VAAASAPASLADWLVIRYLNIGCFLFDFSLMAVTILHRLLWEELSKNLAELHIYDTHWQAHRHTRAHSTAENQIKSNRLLVELQFKYIRVFAVP